MGTTIHSYQYFYIQKQVQQLLNAYTSVNDTKTIATVQALAAEKIRSQFAAEEPLIEEFLEKALDKTLTSVQAERLLNTLKTAVEPFKMASNQQLDKLFRKVKKLKYPQWSELDLQEQTFVGWNDPGKQAKFIILYQDGKLQGVQGNLAPTTTKGICAICQRTSEVSLFLSTTKSAGDGTYTKRGNYICHDSQKCNRQLTQLESLHTFFKSVQKRN